MGVTTEVLRMWEGRVESFGRFWCCWVWLWVKFRWVVNARDLATWVPVPYLRYLTVIVLWDWSVGLLLVAGGSCWELDAHQSEVNCGIALPERMQVG